MTQSSVSEMAYIRITKVLVKSAQSVWPHPDECLLFPTCHEGTRTRRPSTEGYLGPGALGRVDWAVVGDGTPPG